MVLCETKCHVIAVKNLLRICIVKSVLLVTFMFVFGICIYLTNKSIWPKNGMFLRFQSEGDKDYLFFEFGVLRFRWSCCNCLITGKSDHLWDKHLLAIWEREGIIWFALMAFFPNLHKWVLFTWDLPPLFCLVITQFCCLQPLHLMLPPKPLQ